MVNSVCCACNGDSPSFVDDSEEKMEATKRIARLFNEYIFCSLSPIPFSVDVMLLIENAYGLQMSILGSAFIGIAVIVDVMKHRLTDDATAIPAMPKLANLALHLSYVLEL
ncbi:hypothetical protein T4A_6849 [Trichinella pseudospiralis]|uniref:Uncharacterized protein n=1 Tax=Trichinella pseudospiralis TaxID=6337 RepID=A0A0V1DVL9_TRIPS|nr:hypothetical protein T4A_6849 [Trichinella pseudospiralis]